MLTAREYKAGAREKFAWPGGYAVVLFMMDGEQLCHDCARSNAREILTEIHAVRSTGHAAGDSGWLPEGWDIHWEGPALQCANCYQEIPSEYGDPDEEPS